MRIARTIPICLCLAALGACADPAAACDVPVFQYALENWEPDFYGVLIFHRGPVDAESQAAADILARVRSDETAPANVDVRTVDVAGEMPPGIEKIWKAQGDPALPWMVVLPPIRYGVDPTRSIWSRRPTAAEAEALIDSPVRRKIAHAIRAGDAAVWVLVESGDRAADAAAAEVLAREVARAARTIELPAAQDPYAYDTFSGYDEAASQPAASQPAPSQPAASQPAAQATPEPLNPAFSILRVSRSDPAEGVLLAMLGSTDPFLEKAEPAAPMAFPIFGRGRALPPLLGKGIAPDGVLMACDFVAGPCACGIKARCPGMDLLIRTDWMTPPPEPIDVSASSSMEVPAGGSIQSGGGLVRNLAVAAGILAAAAVLAVLLVSRKTARN